MMSQSNMTFYYVVVYESKYLIPMIRYVVFYDESDITYIRWFITFLKSLSFHMKKIVGINFYL